MKTIYQKPDGSLIVRESWDDGLAIETTIGGTTIVIKLDAYQTRDLLHGLFSAPRPNLFGPAER